MKALAALAFHLASVAPLAWAFVSPSTRPCVGHRAGNRHGGRIVLSASSRNSQLELGSDKDIPAESGRNSQMSSTSSRWSHERGAESRAEFLVTSVVGAAASVALTGWLVDVGAATAAASTVADDPPALLQLQVLSYIREALPTWRNLPDSDIELRQITGGITNVIFKARNARTGEGALVRVYGKDTDLLLNRQKEAAVFSELSTLGFGPRKLGEFRGGRIEELLDARAAKPEELLQTRPFDVPQAIAVQLASLHGQRVRSSVGSVDEPVMWPTIDRWLKTATRLDTANTFSLDKVASEVDWLKGRFQGPIAAATIASPDQKLAAEIVDGVVFAHNDLLSGNVLVGPRGAKTISTLRLIDFEYSDYNPCGYDIANHFCECAGFDADFRRKYPSLAQRKRFLKAYVEAARPDVFENTMHAPQSGVAGDGLLNELVERVDRYTLASHLTWALWAIIQANTSEIQGFDFAGYARKRMDGYAFHKGLFYA